MTGHVTNQPFTYQGSGPGACLLIHGLGGGVYELQPLGKRLHQQGWTVRAMNLPGHDQPRPQMPASTWPEWVACVQKEYTRLRQRHEQVAVIGFSNGGLLALYLAAQAPVYRLVLLAPFLGMWRWQWPLLYSVGYVIPSLPRRRLPIADPVMERQAWQCAFFRDFNLAAVRSALALQQRVCALLPQITVPTLVIQARHDRVIDPQATWEGFQRLGSTQKVFHWLDTGNHIITWDYPREQVYRLVQDFLPLPGPPLLD
ncbi:MAG: alpha/beta fold hydrolase [Gloeomargarita sp. SKYG116]|nr:alpha/beta fold hydrolase [Gloeomargarita sp. SKYG116]MCS7225999.1 alpha/beta fold hydrolase [Gloeomargarita sp. SKYB31]MDW8401449.1 alpha/beta fold hydrolase [Gloeomargarita sp. SKYGB_i_bin116]